LDLLSSFFLILIVLMSGGIAVLADDLGRRLGKKRLHFKGIRPKRVAQIGTFLAGVIVSLLTIIIVSIGSSGVRQWIIAGSKALALRDQALKDKDKAVGEFQGVSAQLKETRTSYDELLKTKSVVVKDLDAKKAEIAAKTQEIARQKAELTGLTGQIALLTPKIKTLQARADAADQKVAGLDKRLALGKTQLAAVQAQLAEVQPRLKRASQELEDIKTQNLELFQQNSELEKQRANLTKSNADLEAQKNVLITARDAAQDELKTARIDLEDTQRTLMATQGQLLRTQDDLHEAEKAYQGWKNIASNSRVAPMIYQRGQEVTRLSVPSGISFQSADSQVLSLLRSARISALKLGAMPNGNVPEAGIFGHDKSPDEIKKDLVSKIAGAPEPTVLVAYSMLNAFKGEPVALDVVAYPNPLVYKRGDVVTESVIDGRKDAATIYHQVAGLGQQVRDQAKKDKMIPRTGTDELYGAVSSEDVLKLVGDVKATDRTVRVRAVANDDIRAGDPLKLSFIIR